MQIRRMDGTRSTFGSHNFQVNQYLELLSTTVKLRLNIHFAITQ